MQNNRTEARSFILTLAFLVFYCVYLFIFRGLLLGVEKDLRIDIFKPEPVQFFVMGLLILMYHFCFAGLYFFSINSKWQRMAAVAIALLTTGSLMYGFREWYRVTSEPFFFLNTIEKLPWYAEEKSKFLIANIPLILFLLTVFVFRIMMMFQKDSTAKAN
jgi:hypothetical protein